MKANEHQEQVNLVKWLKIKKIFYFAVPNGSVLKGTPLQRAKQMNNLKAEGLVPGASDIVVLLKDKILFIEMKAAPKKLKSGKLSVSHTKVSDDQINFMQKIVDNFDYADAFICYGFNQATEYIKSNI